MNKHVFVASTVLGAAVLCASCELSTLNEPPEVIDAERDDQPTPEEEGTTKVGSGAEEAPSSPRLPPGGGSARLGWNLDFLYGGGFAFANKMMMARSWVSTGPNGWNDGRPIALDADGWPVALQPGQEVATLVPSHDGGRYVITWEGGGDITVSDVEAGVSRAKNRIVVDTLPDTDMQLRVVATPVRAISVRKIDLPADTVWDPTFVERLADARVLRFMQWGMTNGDEGGPFPVAWAERSSPTWYTQLQRTGVAYEHMIDLCNDLGKDGWFNIPHTASDDYVRRLATLLRDRMDPGLKIYIEWSNEVWNDAFRQGADIRQLGLDAGLGAGDSHVARLQYQSRRTRQVFQIFEDVFKGKMDRIVRVVGSQVGNTFNDDVLFGFEGLDQHADALAVAPYFGHGIGQTDNANIIKNGGVSWVLDELEDVELPDTINWIQSAANSAAKWHVRLIAYEGGQHVVASPDIHNDAAVTSVLESVQRSPRMYDLYLRLLNAWTAAGGELFVHYTYSGRWTKWGYWGALEANDAPIDGNGAHKYRAIVDWAVESP